MIDGVWQGDVVETPAIAAKRATHAKGFRGRIEVCGGLGLRAEGGRYHLYVSYACPFAHRAILVHALKRLDGIVGLSVLHPRWNTPNGWTFGATDLSTPDRGGSGFKHLHEAFSVSCTEYTGRVTVPVLWDTTTSRIVSDDSLAIAQMLDQAFDDVAPEVDSLYPLALQPAISAVATRIADEIAAGFYRIGGAADQATYDLAEEHLFNSLDRLERQLRGGGPYLHGDRLTLSDIVLFTPLLRFEPVYRPLFRALRRCLNEYPALLDWMQRLLANQLIADTVRPDHILTHYYDDWAPRNPRIVPRWTWPNDWHALCR
jgi:putative glutathione S-transferase